MRKHSWRMRRRARLLLGLSLMALAGTVVSVSAPKVLHAQPGCETWEEFFISQVEWWCEPTCCQASCC